ncbi:MAG: glycosyltransferase family 2 protein [Deltaproteobacteria bacterium]|nr:glycosyltransferase family 2 protein [Deltaproteobacteria bacterium]
MLDGKKITVIMPAYNAAATLERTWREIPRSVVDHVIVTDDASQDDTVAVAKSLGIDTIVHTKNRGYGANQKTCYKAALATGADIIIMLHPDYQYSPRLVTPMAGMIASGHYDLVLGSRILGGKARQGGMPFYKYVANRFLTLFENLLCGAKLSEYHTGFRAYTRRLLETVPFESNSDDFVFDNELVVQAIFHDFAVGEISCPTRYFEEASSINFWRSVRYGLGVLRCALIFRLQKMGLVRSALFIRPPD